MPETSSDEEYTKHQNSTLKAGYKILRVNNGKTCLTYSNGNHTHKPQEYKMVALKLYKFKGNIYGGERIMVFQILLRSYFISISIRIFLLKMRKKLHFSNFRFHNLVIKIPFPLKCLMTMPEFEHIRSNLIPKCMLEATVFW